MDQHPLRRCSGGTVTLATRPLDDRRDGAHLLVNPQPEVFKRSELTALELTHWSTRCGSLLVPEAVARLCCWQAIAVTRRSSALGVTPAY